MESKRFLWLHFSDRKKTLKIEGRGLPRPAGPFGTLCAPGGARESLPVWLHGSRRVAESAEENKPDCSRHRPENGEWPRKGAEGAEPQELMHCAPTASRNFARSYSRGTNRLREQEKSFCPQMTQIHADNEFRVLLFPICVQLACLDAV